MDLILLAQDGAAPPTGDPGLFGSPLLAMAVIFLIFWFLVIRPQQKQQKQLKQQVEALKRGDEVRTRGGLIGKVAKVEENSVILRIDLDGKVRVKLMRDAIEAVISGPSGSKRSASKSDESESDES